MSISGEKNLQQLLRSMQPTLLDGAYAFVNLAPGRQMPAGLDPWMTCREAEGTTLLLSEADLAKSGLPHAFFCRGISLNIHSSLYAVGFLAAVTECLARASMSVNIVSAFFRDYIFVPASRAEEAVTLLRKLAQDSARKP